MPDYHRYRLRWGKVGICILENYNFPTTGEALVVQSPAFLDKSPSNETWD